MQLLGKLSLLLLLSCCCSLLLVGCAATADASAVIMLYGALLLRLMASVRTLLSVVAWPSPGGIARAGDADDATKDLRSAVR